MGVGNEEMRMIVESYAYQGEVLQVVSGEKDFNGIRVALPSTNLGAANVKVG